jgi:hypothetical protein
MNIMPRNAALVLTLLVAGCTSKAAAPAAAKAQPAAALPATSAPPAGSQMSAQVSGKVVETLTVGAEVTIGEASWMEDFESKTLNRKFERILFGSLVLPGATAGLPAGHPVIAETGPQASGSGADVPVEKALGKDGRTVAEIYASKATLKGTEIAIRGRVVKFNAGILSRNWMHLRDGSGSAEKQDNDITVTSNEVFAKGDVVLVRGRLALDKDFGAGYVYPLIIEDAKAVK